jgi:hypothetical protein
MQAVMKFLLATLVVLAAFILFSPKKHLYFLGEKQLQKAGIVLHGEKVKEKAAGVGISGARVFYRGMEIGTIRHADLSTLLFHSRVKIEGFSLSPVVSRMMNVSVREIRMDYALWNPGSISVEIDGDFGAAAGEIDLRENRISLRFSREGETFPLLKPYLKNRKGVWIYEQRF